MRDFSVSPVEMVVGLWHNRGLIHTLAKREVLGRYRGTAFGILWSFINPLFMLAVYTFVFSEVFKARWSGNSEFKTEFALVLFAGLIVYNLFAECINRAPSLILTNTNYVKKVVFPLEVLPLVSLLSALYHALISLCVWLLAYVIFYGLPRASLAYLPLVVTPLCLLVLGVSWALASVGVFLRDVSQFIGSLTTVLMFLSPVFYPASALPEAWRGWLYLNPLTSIIEQMRDVLYWGQAPGIELIVKSWATMALVAWLGFAWFQQTRKGFADVL